MKKLAGLLVVVLMMSLCVGAFAEGSSLLGGDKLKQLLETTAAAAAAGGSGEGDGAASAGAAANIGPEVRCDDSFFERIRYSAFLAEDKYSREANVFIELKNVSGKTLYPEEATIVAYNAAGEAIEEETYSSTAPSMVENGQSLFIWDWFYGFDSAISDISYFGVTVETSTDSYHTYAPISASASVADGIASVSVTNEGSEPIYGVETTVVISNADGAILDVDETSTGNAIGIAAGSTMIQRSEAEDYINDTRLSEGICTAYALYEVE